jgi:predicted DNA binding CopG/RHH family protein
MSARKKKPVVKESMSRFRTEDEERGFWAEHDVVDYFDWEKSVSGSFPALKPSTQTISLRLPKALLEELKTLANERDVPYQSLQSAEGLSGGACRARARSEANPS